MPRRTRYIPQIRVLGATGRLRALLCKSAGLQRCRRLSMSGPTFSNLRILRFRIDRLKVQVDRLACIGPFPNPLKLSANAVKAAIQAAEDLNPKPLRRTPKNGPTAETLLRTGSLNALQA